MSYTIMKPVAEGRMQFQTGDGTFTLPFDVICQAADQIRAAYAPQHQGNEPDMSVPAPKVT